jgi:hypothetical protein
MSLKGTGVGAKRAETITGIPYGTINTWWYTDTIPGRRPGPPKRHKCPQGHPFDDENTVYRRSGSRRQRVCRKCERARRSRYKWKNLYKKYHPIHNPDVELANVDHLWFESERVMAYLLDQFTLTEIHAQIDEAMKRNLKRARSAEWMKYVFADRLFSALGLALAMMTVEPVLGSYFPPGHKGRQHA